MPFPYQTRQRRIRILRLLFVTAITLFAPPRLEQTVNAQSANGKVPLTHETMWMMKRVGAPVPSPDGQWVVFSLVEPAYEEKDQISDLWIVSTDGVGKPRRLTFSKGSESGMAWSPDSQRLAFSAKREGDDVNQIYVLNIADGESLMR